MRKKNNNTARLARARQAIISQHKVAVINIDPVAGEGVRQQVQTLINHRTGAHIRAGHSLAGAVHDIAMPWVVCVVACCKDQSGQPYLSSAEFSPVGVRRANDLTDLIKDQYVGLVASCNRSHLVTTGWLAIPSAELGDDGFMDDEALWRIFSRWGAWDAEVAA